MKKISVRLLSFLAILALLTAYLPAQAAQPQPHNVTPLFAMALAGDPGVPGPVELRFDPNAQPASFAPTAPDVLRPHTGTIVMDYIAAGSTNTWGYTCMAFPAAAQTAFQAAADVWETLINSAVTIRIEACWADLATGILGSSGAINSFMNFTNAPQVNTFYQVALANALAGVDLDPTRDDMAIMYNNDYINNFYYGTDGNTGGKTDFMSVVMHEIAHALGFAGRMNVSGGVGTWGINYGGTYYPVAYDRSTYSSTGTALISYTNNSAALGTALTTADITYRGANAKKAYCDNNVPLYTPSTWAGGSSYSHFSDAMDTYDRGQNAMMTYSIGANQVYHHPGAVGLGLLRDVGWNIGGALNTPTGVTAVQASPTSILVSWTDTNASPNETGYVIERSPDGTTGWTVITTTAANATSYTNTGLTTGTPYYYKVRAANGAAIYCASAVVSAIPTNALSAPANLTAAAVSPTQINLSWTDTNSAPINETNYLVQRSNASGGPYTTIATLPPDTTSYQNNSLIENSRWYYQVIAHGTTDSLPSNSANALTPLVAPTNVVVTTVSATRLDLSWSNNSGAETGYKVERATAGPSGPWTTIANLGGSSLTGYNDTTASEGTLYYYQITAVNTSSGAVSTPGAGQGRTRLGTPANLTSAQAAPIIVELFWTDASSAEVGYQVQRSPDGSSGWADACGGLLAPNSTRCVDSVPGKGTFFYRVRAVYSDAAYNSPYTLALTVNVIADKFIFLPTLKK